MICGLQKIKTVYMTDLGGDLQRVVWQAFYEDIIERQVGVSMCSSRRAFQERKPAGQGN